MGNKRYFGYDNVNSRSFAPKNKDINPKGYLLDLSGEALIMAAQGNFIYMMYLDEDKFYRNFNVKKRLLSSTDFIKVWMAPATGIHLNQYKELIKYKKEYQNTTHDNRSKFFNKKMTKLIHDCLQQFLDYGNWTRIYYDMSTINRSRLKYRMYDGFHFSKKPIRKATTESRWSVDDDADSGRSRKYSPVFSIYTNILNEIITRFGASTSRIVNFINYQYLPADFWNRYFRRIRNIK